LYNGPVTAYSKYIHQGDEMNNLSFINKYILSSGILASLFIGTASFAETITVNSFSANIISQDLQITAVEASLSCEKKGLFGGTSEQSLLAQVVPTSQDTYSVITPQITVSALSGYSQCDFTLSFEAGKRVSSFVIANEILQPGKSKLIYFKDAKVITAALAQHLNGAELIKDDSKLGGASLKLQGQ
jgi:hypothetical protein